MTTAKKTRRYFRLAFWLLSPVWLLVLLFGWDWTYERIELSRLASRVDSRTIPGTAISEDGKNNWPFGTSNGSFVRVNWLIASYEPVKLKSLADSIDVSDLGDGARVELTDLGPISEDVARETSMTPDDAHLYLLRVSYGRDNRWWEEFPGD